jgi:hypothetical protein
MLNIEGIIIEKILYLYENRRLITCSKNICETINLYMQ